MLLVQGALVGPRRPGPSLANPWKGSPPCPCTCWKRTDHEWHIYDIYEAGAVKHPFISMGTDIEKE